MGSGAPEGGRWAGARKNSTELMGRGEEGRALAEKREALAALLLQKRGLELGEVNKGNIHSLPTAFELAFDDDEEDDDMVDHRCQFRTLWCWLLGWTHFQRVTPVKEVETGVQT